MMILKNNIATILLSLACIFSSSFGFAEGYLYIQGDKQTPIYVKVNGRMMPRYGQNYSIVPKLQGETVNIEVLFQTNKYPIQKFKVRVPQDGGRGLLLVKQTDQQFSLYDLQTNGYIPNGNLEDEAFVVLDRKADPIYRETNTSRPKDIPAFIPEKKQKDSDPNIVIESTKSSSPFLENIDLSKPKKTKRQEREEARQLRERDNGIVKTDDLAPSVAIQEVTIPNSDCKEPLPTADFEDLAAKVLDMNDDSDRLKYIGKVAGRRACFSTEQVRILGKLFKSQSGRLLLFKELYPKVTDQSNYKDLATMLSTSYLREEFLKSL